MSYTVDGATGLLKSASVEAYSNALKGLNLEQAKLVLSTKQLSDTQKEQILTEAGLLKTTGDLTTAQLTEILTSKTRTAADAQALLINTGLITSETAEATATNTVTAAKLKELVATKQLTQAEANLIAKKAGITMMNGKETASIIGNIGSKIKGAGSALAGFGKGVLTLASAHPVIAGITTAITVFGGAAIANKIKQEKAAKAIKEAYEEAKTAIDEINNNYESNTSKTKSIAQEYAELAQGVDLLTNKNKNLSTEKHERFLELSNELSKMYPPLTKSFDENGNAILDLSGDVDTIVGSLDDLIERQRALANQEIVDKMPDLFAGYSNNVSDYKKELEDAEKHRDAIQQAYNNLEKYGFYSAFEINGYGTGDGKRSALGLGGTVNNLKVLGMDVVTETIKDEYGQAIGTLIKFADGASISIEDIHDAYISSFNNAVDDVKYAGQQLKAETTKINQYLNTWLQTEFSYSQIQDEGLQKAVQEMMFNFDWDSLPEGIDKNDWEAVSEYLRRNILFAINNVQDNPEISNAISEIFTNQELSPEQANILIKQIQDYFGKDNPISVYLQYQFEENETTQKQIDSAISKFGEGSKGDLKAFFEKNSINTQEEVDKWNEITKGTNNATEAMEKYVQGSTSLNKMTDSLENLKTASESVATLQKAFKELSEDGYITVDTLAEIQKATGLNDDAFENYKNTLLTAKAGSEEFDNVLSELTYKILESKFATTGLENATEEEIAAVLRENGVLNANEIAIEAIEKAKLNAMLQSDDFADKTDEEKISLIDEAMAATTDANSIQQLAFVKSFYENIDKIDTSAEVEALMAEAQAAGMNAESLLRLAKVKELLEKAEDAKNHKNGFDYQQYTKQAKELLESPFSFDVSKIKFAPLGGGTSSLPDKPEEVQTAPKEHERDNSYSDFFDEILADRQKAREVFEKKDEQLQKELEQALEDLDLEGAERIAQAIADNENEYQRILGEQLEQSQNALNNEILPAMFEIAPDLKGKAWEAITEVEKEKIRQGLEQAKLDAKNAIIDEENRLQAELDALETQWNQASYNRKLANGNKEDETYKKAEAEFKAKKDALEKNIDAITASDSPLQQAVEAAEKQIEAWDGLTNSAEDYAEDIKEIPGLINESQERIEQSSEDLKGGLDDLFSEYERHIDRQTKALQEQADAYDILIDKAQAKLDAERAMYDALRNVREIQRDIEKELAQNKALGEYLDKSTRKLLFNDDDYSKLSSKLNGMTKDIASINSWYQSQINSLTKDNWYLESAITAEYERRLAMKEKEYEIARAELDLEKKKLELNNVLNEKHIRMLTKDSEGNYKWEQVHDVEEAARVVGEIADLEAQIEEIKLQAAEESAMNQRQAEINALQTEQAALQKRIELMNKETEHLAMAVEDITNPLMNFGNLVTQLNSRLATAIATLGGTVGSDSVSGDSSGSGGSGGGGSNGVPGNIQTNERSPYVYIPTGSTWSETMLLAQEKGANAQEKYDEFIAAGNGTNVQHAQDLKWVIDKAASRQGRSAKEYLKEVEGRDFSAEIAKAENDGNYTLAKQLEKERNLKIDLTGSEYEKTYKYNDKKDEVKVNPINIPDDDDKPKVTAAYAYDNGGIAKGKGFMFKNTDFDEMVLDPVQTNLFEKFIENTKGFDIVANQMNNMINSYQPPQVPMNATTNNNRNVTFTGDIVLNNVREPQNFMGELAKALNHYNF